jgi:ligand-binding sensor domain-containing protein
MKKMWRLRRAIVFGLIYLFVLQRPYVSAQESAADETLPRIESRLRFAHLDSDDGLVFNNVEAIVQDRNGFMWFGTQAGLSRYDGYRVTSFQHDPANPNSLSHNHVRDLYEADDGMIWIATEGGSINRLDPDSLTFSHFAAPPGTPNTIVGDRHFTILQDSRGHLWFGGTNVFGLGDYDPADGTTTTYYQNDRASGGLQGSGIRDLVETENRVLWISAG